MSGLNWGIGDLLAVTKLAWDLYHNCYLVAREAPEEFRQLVNELASLQGVLRTLRDDVNSDKSFLERLGENRKQTLERCLAGCFETLQKLQELVVKYKKLGIGDGLQFWRKIKWVSQRPQIAALKSKVMVHTCNISLCMSSIGNSSLSRIEAQLAMALEKQDAEPTPTEEAEEAEDKIEDIRPLTKSRTTPAAASESDGPSNLGIYRAFTGSTLVAVDRTMTTSPDSTPSMESDDYSETALTGPTTPGPRKSSGSISRKGRQPSSSSAMKKYTSSSLGSEDAFNEPLKRSQSEKQRPFPHNPLSTDGTAPDVFQAVAEAMKELSKIRMREQSARPLRIVPQDPVHRPDDALREKFRVLADDELKIRRLNARDWLRVATWWLLKARHTMNNCDRPSLTNARGSVSLSTDSRSPTSQAYVDLLKASYILYDIILKDDNLTPLLTDENRKLFYNLSDGINEDFENFKSLDVPERGMIDRQNLNIWELLQPEEESYDEDDLMPGLENSRWITVEQDDAGEEDEQVLFRSFVNAEIGGKRYRMRTRGAPYMLLLSTKEGESEPKVTICNQSGTLCLQRDFLPEDIVKPDAPSSPISGMHQALGATEALPLNFGRMNVSVSFLYQTDLDRFMYIPDAYFKAVKKREPRMLRNATETLLFKSSVEIFEVLKATTMKPLNPRQLSQSCDLRILETTHKEGWRASRRIVISSSAADKRPWSIDFFMPLSRVQISREGVARQVLVKWSDTTQERADKTDGAYNKVYSYVYDDSNPNIAFRLDFRTQADATDFEQTILTLSLPAIYSWSQGLNNHHVYDISDTEPNPKQYKGIMEMTTKYGWKWAEVFYMYRDTDYHYDRANLRIRFPQVYYPDYISTHVEQLFKPDRDPVFSHCTKKVGNLTVEFDDEPKSQAFMNALTAGHDLIYSRRALWVTTKEKSKFRSSKSNKGNAEVQLWKKGNAMRLTSRWEDVVADKWITLTVPRSAGLHHQRDSNRASLPKVDFDRGTQIDMANITARNPKVAAEGKRIGPITIAFETVLDREEFVAALEGRTVQKMRSPLDDLLVPVQPVY